jgi:hypothetical protein
MVPNGEINYNWPSSAQSIFILSKNVMCFEKGPHFRREGATIIGHHNFVHKKKLHCLSPRANYTDRATAACRRSDCQLLRIESATWSA